MFSSSKWKLGTRTRSKKTIDRKTEIESLTSHKIFKLGQCGVSTRVDDSDEIIMCNYSRNFDRQFPDNFY